MSKEERAAFAAEMVGGFVDAACTGMNDEERKGLVEKVTAAMNEPGKGSGEGCCCG